MIARSVRDVSQVAVARRSAVAEAQRLGFGEGDAGRVALVATELATNVIRHAGGGELLIGIHEGDGAPGVQIIAIDTGRGMADIDASLRDGYSTAGSAGTGLGAVMRQSDLFDIYSQPGAGTAVLSILAARGAKLDGGRAPIVWGAVCIPAPGEDVCGDGWSVEWNGRMADLTVADGLGHGTGAAAAASAVIAAGRRFRGLALSELMERLNAAAAATRGAAAAIARLDLELGQLHFAGIGNIAGTIIGPDRARKTVSYSGILGHAMKRARQFDYPLPSGALIVLNSDGLQTNWTLDRYTGLAARHPSLIAAILYRDFQRGRDDATVLVARPRLP
jgi:anti-sigma regulatory factor (Ser/Thr protein kinase)